MQKKQFYEPPVGTLYGEEEIKVLRKLLFSNTTLTRGVDVQLFEKEFAEYCGAKYAVAVSSCSASLRIAAQVLRIREKDEVIAPANAFWNTVVPLVERKVSVRFADIDDYSLTIDPAKLEKLITSKTKAIFILSFGGNPCDMDRLRAIARKHNIPIVEDAAHSAGAIYKGKKIGNLSDISCFSFSTLKNMGTMGEGGMFVTNNEKYADEAKKLRECWPLGVFKKCERASIGKYKKPLNPFFMRSGDAFSAEWTSLEEIGTNFKMSSPQAAVGRVQLRKLDRHNGMREAIANQYDEFVNNTKGLKPTKIYKGSVSSWHLYNFFVLPEAGVDRNELIKRLKEDHGIHLINRFWPLHLHNIFRLRGHRLGEAPVCERIWFKEQVALPIAPIMDKKQVSWLLSCIHKVYNSLSKKHLL